MPDSQIKVDFLNHMGDDLSVVNAARVSFDKQSEWFIDEYSGELVIGKLSNKDTKLIHYLARHKHLSPFGHCFASFRVTAPVFVRAQLVKHEYLRMNEISRRYVTEPPEFYTPDVWRKKAENVKQGSTKEPLIIEGQRFCKTCKVKLSFLRKEDEQMKVFCSPKCQGIFYTKQTDKGWAVKKHCTLKSSADRRGIPFSITVDDVIELGRPSVCPYLEIPLDYENKKLLPNSPSVNRIDHTKGYEKGNLEIVSQKANSMFASSTDIELKLFLKNVAATRYGTFFEHAPSVGKFYEKCKNVYAELIEGGLCPEQARMFMPQAQLTSWIWSGSLDAFANMVNLRIKPDAQYETRLVAQQIDTYMRGIYPVSWGALVDASGV